MDTTIVITDKSDREYFCNGCGQLRLWCRGAEPIKCGNCSSADVVEGAPGSLDKEALQVARSQREPEPPPPSLSDELRALRPIQTRVEDQRTIDRAAAALEEQSDALIHAHLALNDIFNAAAQGKPYSWAELQRIAVPDFKRVESALRSGGAS